MATVLQLRFPGRRYHATPWGSHVNEGQVEWPPSPFRLLRALLCTGFLKLGWEPQGPPALARRLIERLAAQPPSYLLPPAPLAHSRHYVDAAGKKPLIFDTWAQLDDGVVEVVWDVALPEDERALLDALAARLGCLGRAESWVEATLVALPTRPCNCAPLREAAVDREQGEQEPQAVLCAMDAAAYAAWRAEQVAPIEAEHCPAPGKRLSAAQQKKREAALAPYPGDLIAALCCDTGALQAQGWSAAPGSRQVRYGRRRDAHLVPCAAPQRQPAAELVPLALLALTTPSRSKSALPPLPRVFPQGRLLHRALASVIGKQLGGDAALARCLLGVVDEGGARRAAGGHQHAHLLYLDLDGDQRLDHALVYAPQGLSAAALDALQRLRKTYSKGHDDALQLALAGHGDAADLLAVAGEAPRRALTRVLGPSRVWESETPYLAPRMTKRSGRDRLEEQVRLECQQRGLPRPALVTAGALLHRQHHYIVHDHHDPANRHEPPWRARHALRLEFAEPVPGPLCLGYGAHVGLGRFKAVG